MTRAALYPRNNENGFNWLLFQKNYKPSLVSSPLVYIYIGTRAYIYSSIVILFFFYSLSISSVIALYATQCTAQNVIDANRIRQRSRIRFAYNYMARAVGTLLHNNACVFVFKLNRVHTELLLIAREFGHVLGRAAMACMCGFYIFGNSPTHPTFLGNVIPVYTLCFMGNAAVVKRPTHANPVQHAGGGAVW